MHPTACYFLLPFLPPCMQVPEEASAVYNVLSIIENMVEVRPAVAEQVLAKTKVGRRLDRRASGQAGVLAACAQTSALLGKTDHE